MKYHQIYGGVIWTNHAIERMQGRGLTQQAALSAFSHPDKRYKGKNPGSIEYVKDTGTHTITLIAKQNERNEWVIISAWIDPPLPGSIDIKKKEMYKKYQKASLWGKLWLTLRSQLGF